MIGVGAEDLIILAQHEQLSWKFHPNPSTAFELSCEQTNERTDRRTDNKQNDRE